MPRRLLLALILLCLALRPPPPPARSRAPRALVDSCEKATIEQDGTGVFDGPDADDRGARPHADALHAADAAHGRTTAGPRSRRPASASGPPRRPARSRYVYTKRVENLLAPGAYRVAVRFRWLDASATGR